MKKEELQKHLNALYSAAQNSPMPARDHVACQDAYRVLATFLDANDTNAKPDKAPKVEGS